MVEKQKHRTIIFYKNYFEDFLPGNKKGTENKGRL